MEILVKTGQFLLAISILVVLHELGHFLFAKLFKTRVEKFYLFFNPGFSLFKKQIGETEYGIGWLPLGGYVKISGMIDESMDKEQMKQPAQPYEFRSKPTWQRLLIMLGGVLVNFVLALVIYSAILYTWGDQFLPTKNVNNGIMVDSLAYEIGLRNGDKIISVDNKEVNDFYQIIPFIVLNDGKTIQVDRNGEKREIPVPQSLIPQLLKATDFIEVRIPFYIAGFSKESKADEAGMQIGDQIIGLNESSIKFFDEFKDSLAKYKTQEVKVALLRETDTIYVTTVVPDNGLLGIGPDGTITKFFELERNEYTFIESIPAGVNKGLETFSSYLKQLKLIFSPKTEAYKSLGGFITIGKIFPSTWDWRAFWNLTAFLSIILAIMNVLPIPALDGGHVTFLLYEMITGHKPSDKFLEYAQITGMIILLALLIYANGNDIVRLFN
ncbi:MAG: RIP metalloprotease RseP [Bacteroidetes bacterium GWF2_33_16]|nr:MAG: RIP metalloprotease RseP [Bacteroidetes bacterium GWE2_32_14]OFY03954.1 MAG: RIP metalloprotease RseP [Bacteroidetes bacterium GWF2_33_16]